MRYFYIVWGIFESGTLFYMYGSYTVQNQSFILQVAKSMQSSLRLPQRNAISWSMPGVVVGVHRPVTPDGSCRPSVEHAGSRSPRALWVFCALHGRWHYTLLLFRSALESFVSARRWTHERVSAAGGRRNFGYTRAALDPDSEVSRGRGSSPVAEAVPSHPGRPSRRENLLVRGSSFSTRAVCGVG